MHLTALHGTVIFAKMDAFAMGLCESKGTDAYLLYNGSQVAMIL